MNADPPSQARCTCFAVRRAARHLTQAYDRHLAPTGLRTTQFSLLSALAAVGARAASSGSPATWGSTAPRSAATCARSSATGWSRSGSTRQDRRGRALTITDAGEAKLRDAEARLGGGAGAASSRPMARTPTSALHTTMDAVRAPAARRRLGVEIRCAAAPPSRSLPPSAQASPPAPQKSRTEDTHVRNRCSPGYLAPGARAGGAPDRRGRLARRARARGGTTLPPPRRSSCSCARCTRSSASSPPAPPPAS